MKTVKKVFLKEGEAGENFKVTGNKCYRCGYEWIPHEGERPITCPSCRSPYWRTPRVRFPSGGKKK